MKIPMLTRLLLLALVVGPLAAWAFLQADSCSRTRAPEWAGANRANELICVADFVRQADNSRIHLFTQFALSSLDRLEDFQ